MAGQIRTGDDGRPAGGDRVRLVGRVCQWLYSRLSVDDPRSIFDEAGIPLATDGTGSITSTTSRRAGAIVAQAVAWLLWIVAIGGTLYLLQAIEKAEGYHDVRAKQGRETTSAVVLNAAATCDARNVP